MKKTLLYIAVFALIIIPSVTFAAWYEPWTWFQKSEPTVVVPVTETAEIPVVTAPAILPTPKPIITNTITVTDPKLQSQINTLEQQNATLQAQLTSLTAQYNSLVSQNTSLNSQIATLQTSAQTSAVPVSNNLVVNKISTIGSDSMFSIENDSNTTQQIFGLGLDAYTYSLPIQAFIQHDTCIGSPIISQIVSSKTPSGGFSFQTPMNLLPHAKETFCVHDAGNVHNISSVTSSGGANVIGVPIEVSDTP